MTEEETPTPSQDIDIDSLPVTRNIVDLHQEGNFLVGLTEFGIRFRQHIPHGKRLNKRGGKFVLEDMEIA
jgi:hypothetical protein